MQEKPIPEPGTWGTKKAKASEPAVVFRVTAVDPVKEHLTVQRFMGYLDGGAPLLGRKSTLDFKTWQTNRYHPCEAPAAPVPEMPPVAAFVAPEPTLADVLASNEALRAEVAGLRADFRALMKAIEAAGGQLPLFRVAA